MLLFIRPIGRLVRGPALEGEAEAPFDAGTRFVVNAIKNSKNKNFFSVAGGGDTISVLNQANAFGFFSFISTGGGAFLEFIQGSGLPGLDSLNN